ncbi:methyltransferase domain-containing protein [candidate division KSB1 bacterium]|nr:methyltransferase domain-containing protein [candidate division KSB1 bacterium]
MNITKYNQAAWDAQVHKKNKWTVPVEHSTIERARSNDLEIYLTPESPVPTHWLEPIRNARMLCLASGGGQQGPILAAAGADVTVLDQSYQQLIQDYRVAKREQLKIDLIQGNMLELDLIADHSFDVIINPASTCFVPDVRLVYQHVARILRPQGRFMTGFINPFYHIFDYEKMMQGQFILRHSLPYSDQENLSQDELQDLIHSDEPLVFSHTLGDLLGGQLQAGLAIIELFEDNWKGQPLEKFSKIFLATLSRKI